jgi:uncharacterized membrane protein YdcZ (DUF606 family)
MTQRSEILAIAAMILVVAAAVASRLAPHLPAAVTASTLSLASGIAVYSLVLWRREQARDPLTRALSRIYLREFMPAMLGYAAAVLLSVWLLRDVESTGLRALVALLPVLPIALCLRATARYIRGLDEMQRRIELEAIALGSIGVAFAYLTGGFLQAARVAEVSATTAMLWVLPALCLAYGIAKCFVVRHYH